jgi:uncharacterized protein YbaP (TraB family)
MRRPERWRHACALLLAGLFGLLAPALRAADLGCSARLERDVPVAAPAHRQGLLWEVTSPAGVVGHLLGTIHLSSPEVTNLSPQLRAVLDGSARFGMEVLFDAPTLKSIAESMWGGDAGGLRAQADPALFARAVELLADHGIDEATAGQLKPWAVYTTLSLPVEQQGPPLDLLLMNIAEQGGKTLFGVETLAEQLAVFERLSAADQITLLRETVCHYDALQHDLQTLVTAYAAGDLAQLYREAQRYESPVQRRLMATLLDERNVRMANRLLPQFESPGTFVAIGALHLPGPGGLLERLTQAGFRVRALDR